MLKIKKPEKVPIINESKCINCDKCITACPKNAICKKANYNCSKCIKYCLSIKVPCNPEHYIFCYEQCDACGLCIPACPVDAIIWYKVPE
jgi:Pyruvate/2-oxoacid:ferredoxin oxidoreductase delta subunit